MRRALARNADKTRYKISQCTAVSRPNAFVLFVSRGKLSEALPRDERFGSNLRYESALPESDRSILRHYISIGPGTQSREAEI
jgi:hypothetical protein